MYSSNTRLICKGLLILVFALVMIGMRTDALAQGDSEVNQQLARLRAATAKYHDINVALEDGFTLIPPGTCYTEDDGNTVGLTYVNIPRFLSPEINPDEPEALSYIPTGGGNVRLTGVAFANRAIFRDKRPPATPGYRPGLFPWQQFVIPAYLEEVSGPFSLFGQQAHRDFSGRWQYELNVWLWSPNPNGIFAETNPALSCPPVE